MSGHYPRDYDGWYEASGSRPKPLNRIPCGCLYRGIALEKACEQHTLYVIQEEP